METRSQMQIFDTNTRQCFKRLNCETLLKYLNLKPRTQGQIENVTNGKFICYNLDFVHEPKISWMNENLLLIIFT